MCLFTMQHVHALFLKKLQLPNKETLYKYFEEVMYLGKKKKKWVLNISTP